jgi:hypothetical protein
VVLHKEKTKYNLHLISFKLIFMSLKVTIDIFSGRPNPTVELTAKEAKELFQNISPTGAMRKASATTPAEPAHLGLRGIQVEQIKSVSKELPSAFYLSHETMYSGGKAAALKGPGTMDRLFKILSAKGSSIANAGKVREFLKTYKDALAPAAEIREKTAVPVGPILIDPKLLLTCTCGPIYEPTWWNNNPTIKGNNNCYNYACNQRTDSFAQPGRATGNMYTSLSGCSVAAGQKSAKQGAVSDALVDTPLANNQCPASGHLVALVIWPGVDFHWYRKGVNTMWSHKPGSTSVTNLDNSGNVISDPRTANRGGYTQFCTFMNVLPGHINIK